MKKLLFLIHDLAGGGAEKALVNLVNRMDREKWNITVMVLFGGGVNESLLHPDIRLIRCHKKAIPGNSHWMKLFSPRFLYRRYITEHYDAVISFLEGPCARIVSGCDDPDTKTVAWIHGTLADKKGFSLGFRHFAEAQAGYSRFDRRIFVSEDTRNAFAKFCPRDAQVLYNVIDIDHIRALAQEAPKDGWFGKPGFYLCGMGKLTANKGFDRLLRIHCRLRQEGFALFTCLLGEGEQRRQLELFVAQQHLQDSVCLPGYQTNPYFYIQNSQLFVCASHSEGFSTAVTEALLLGTPVCSTQVSGAQELLGDNAFGVITENSEEALYQGIRSLLENPALLTHYQKQAKIRAQFLGSDRAVGAVEQMLEELFL